uniref:Reticulocalbin-3 n=1 Tax=Romanomermis culicivorax TaxID=13658 RepID=A0A915IKQ1_ROMCU
MYNYFTLLILLSVSTFLNASPQQHKSNAHIEHERILSESGKDAEKVSKMSPEEGHKRLRALAKRMDENNDQFVDKDELLKYVSKILTKIDQEEAEETFEDSDSDSDNFVTWKEHKDFSDSEKDEDDEENQKLLNDDQTYFQAADQNRDGKLNKEEYMAFKNPESNPRMHNILINNALKDKDKNSDGYIDLDEYLADKAPPSSNVKPSLCPYAGNRDEEWLTTEKFKFNEEYDQNKDGKLDRMEMKRWLVPDHQETAKEEAEHLMEEADKNRDEKLSYDEIASEYDLFASSEATNYGADLETIHRDEL